MMDVATEERLSRIKDDFATLMDRETPPPHILWVEKTTRLLADIPWLCGQVEELAEVGG